MTIHLHSGTDSYISRVVRLKNERTYNFARYFTIHFFKDTGFIYLFIYFVCIRDSAHDRMLAMQGLMPLS